MTGTTPPRWRSPITGTNSVRSLGFRTLVTTQSSSGALPTRSTFTSKPWASSMPIVAMAESAAEAIPAGARINPQAPAANAISVSSVARMAGLRSFRLVGVSRFNGRRSQGVQRHFRNFRQTEKDPAAGGSAGSVLPALRRRRDSLLRRFFGTRGAIVVNHGEFVERVLSTQNGVHL